MIIGFYLEYGSMADTIELGKIDMGNPGIGGTKYLFLLIVKYLNRQYGIGTAILYTDAVFNSSDEEIPIRIVNDLKQAVKVSAIDGAQLLVVNGNIVSIQNESVFSKSSVDFVVWAHNTVSGRSQKIIRRQPNIKRVVCVSEQQYKNMRDTSCFSKCTFINNCLPKRFFQNVMVSDHSQQTAVYVGSLFPQKGVHNLIEIWVEVLKKVPEAQLYVIGGSQVWNPNIKTGPLGVTEPFYEKVIIKKTKKLLKPDSVHFLGAKSWNEITPLISKCRVGVVNPSHYMRDETFCMSAIELSAHEIPIISRQRGDGLVTTVLHGRTGYLEKTDEKIVDRLVELLIDQRQAEQMGRNAREFASAFCVDTIIHDWANLISDAGSSSTKKENNVRRYAVSRDALYLNHDKLLHYWYVLASGKLLAKLCKRKECEN